MKTQHILMAGSGGQGLVLLGKLLANAALKSVPHITFFPSYGAEMRGGTSHCQVIPSPTEIPSPVAETFDLMILMNQESVDKFIMAGDQHGFALVNSTLCAAYGRAPAVRIPATTEADKLGDTRAANLVMLGALIARRPVVPASDIQETIQTLLGGKSTKIIDLNLSAFQRGLSL
jgi:2-oxoglutarate ferredoxin oxidoreductase subunit gamma